MAKPSRDWISELILALLMVTQGEARKGSSWATDTGVAHGHAGRGSNQEATADNYDCHD